MESEIGITERITSGERFDSVMKLLYGFQLFVVLIFLGFKTSMFMKSIVTMLS